MRSSILRSIGILILLAAVVLSACSSIASPEDNAIGGTVWGADEEGNSITVINAATNKVVTTLEGIEGAHNLQVAPDGKTVWAVSGHDALAVMLNTSTYKVHGVVPTGMEPAHIILLPDGRTAYATNGSDNTVTVIDIEKKAIVATVPSGNAPNGISFSPLPAIPANSTTLQLELPESDMPEMPHQ